MAAVSRRGPAVVADTAAVVVADTHRVRRVAVADSVIAVPAAAVVADSAIAAPAAAVADSGAVVPVVVLRRARSRMKVAAATVAAVVRAGRAVADKVPAAIARDVPAVRSVAARTAAAAAGAAASAPTATTASAGERRG